MTVLIGIAIGFALALYHAWVLSIIGHWYGFNMPYKEWFGILLMFRLMVPKVAPKEINQPVFWFTVTVGPLVALAVAFLVMVLL